MRNKIIEKFISKSEKLEIIDFVNNLDFESVVINKHIDSVSSKLNGESYMFDITKSEKSREISLYQSSNNLMTIDPIKLLIQIIDRISDTLEISKDNVFLQILNQEAGGYINPHYDTSIDGHITYKCNISILSDNYELFVGDDMINISELDLYCFEASLYKHWTNPFSGRRVILSYGFILPYADLGRSEYDPRVRLSKRIFKYFQSK